MADEPKKSGGGCMKLGVGAVVAFLIAAVFGGIVVILAVGGTTVLAFLGGIAAFVMVSRDAGPPPAPIAITAPVVEPIPEPPLVDPVPVPEPVVEAPRDDQPSTTSASSDGTADKVAAKVDPKPDPKPDTKVATTGAATTSDDDFAFDADPAPAAKVAPAADPGVRVSVSGKAKVVLIGADKRYALPTNVPPGKYDIEATFAGEPPVVTGKATISDSTATIMCNEAMGICRKL